MSINAKLDASRFFATMEKLALVTKRDITDVITQQAKLAAKEFINIIPPTYGPKQDKKNPDAEGKNTALTGTQTLNVQKKSGEAAVIRDVGAAYMTKGQAYAIIKRNAPDKAKRFWKLIQTDVPAARNFIRDEVPELKFIEKVGGFDVSFYKTARNKRTGRVNLKYPRQIITEKSKLTALIKQQKAKVGTAKSGAYKAAKQAGLNVATPAWITSKGGSGAGKNDLRNPIKPSITLTVTVPYIDYHNRGNRLVIAVLGNRTRAMERDMQAKINKVWKGKI